MISDVAVESATRERLTAKQLLSASFRSRSVGYLLVIGIPLTVVMTRHELVASGSPIYWPDITAKAATIIHISGPLSAGFAAYESYRAWVGSQLLRSGGRRPSTAMARRLLPLVGGSFVMLVVCLAVSASAKTAPRGIPDWRIVVVFAVASCGYVAFGAAVGHWMNPAVSIPLSVVVVFLAIGLPPAGAPYWVRHLTGDLVNCCGTSETLSRRVFWASVILWCALSVAGLFTASAGRVPAWVCWYSVVVAGALLGGRAWLDGVGHNPVDPRQSQTVCMDSSVRVCVWPEHRVELAVAANFAGQLHATLAAGGIATPPVASERLDGSGPTQWLISVSDRPSARSTAHGVARGLIPTVPSACFSDDYGGMTLNVARDQLEAFLLLKIGDKPEYLGYIEGREIAAARRAAKLPPAQQRAWYHKQRSIVLSCPLVP